MRDDRQPGRHSGWRWPIRNELGVLAFEPGQDARLRTSGGSLAGGSHANSTCTGCIALRSADCSTLLLPPPPRRDARIAEHATDRQVSLNVPGFLSDHRSGHPERHRQTVCPDRSLPLNGFLGFANNDDNDLSLPTRLLSQTSGKEKRIRRHSLTTGIPRIRQRSLRDRKRKSDAMLLHGGSAGPRKARIPMIAAACTPLPHR